MFADIEQWLYCANTVHNYSFTANTPLNSRDLELLDSLFPIARPSFEDTSLQVKWLHGAKAEKRLLTV
jgi:hypothetical protein